MSKIQIQARKPIAIELCAGLGGMGIGLRAIGFDVVRAYDSWNEAVAVYNHNFPGDLANQCNLLTAGGRAAVAADKKALGEIEIVAAGPPCKGYSQLRNGHHDGRNGHNRVLAAMPVYIELLQPKYFLLENVPDLIRHRDGKTLAALLGRLRAPMGGFRYGVEYRIYDAARYGIPQARRRVLIFGVRDDSPPAQLPEPDADLAPLFSALRHGGKIPKELEIYLSWLKDPENGTLTTAAQALSDLPSLGAGEPEKERSYASDPQNAFQRLMRANNATKVRDTRTPGVKEETIKRLRHIPPGGCARAIPAEHLNGLSRRYDSAYRRLHPSVPSTALSTKYDCVYHYARERSLSVREYCRLQGIPDSITFPAEVVCRRSAYEMIGNSVPPLLIQRVLERALGMTS